MKCFNACGYSLPLGEKTYIMGILNVTPDSFSDGGLYNNKDAAIKRAIEMQDEGADIIDIGAQSTRPGYTKIDSHTELKRLSCLLPLIRREVDIPISVDTFYPEVAKEAIEMGADIINDVTGFKNDKMIEVASHSRCGLIVMHDMPGTDLNTFFYDRLKVLNENNITNSRICFDPGIGFSKTHEENLYIIKNLSNYLIKDCAMLMAASRKRVIGNPCGNPPFEQRMPGTIAAHTIAIMGGADIIRVHDVKEAVQGAKVADAILNCRL